MIEIEKTNTLDPSKYYWNYFPRIPFDVRQEANYFTEYTITGEMDLSIHFSNVCQGEVVVDTLWSRKCDIDFFRKFAEDNNIFHIERVEINSGLGSPYYIPPELIGKPVDLYQIIIKHYKNAWK